MSPKWRRRTSASCDAVQVSFFFQRLCLAAPAPVSSGLPRCWNAACRTDSIQKKSMTGVGSEHTNVDCKSWRKLSAPFKFSVTPRLDVWTNPLFLDQLRRSDAVQERAVLNETPEVAEISYFFFSSSSSTDSSVWLHKSSLPPRTTENYLSYLFLSASTKRCQALTLLATQKATGGKVVGGGTGTEWVSETVAWSIELKSAAFKEKRINKSNPRGGHLIWAEKRGGGFQVEKSPCALDLSSWQLMSRVVPFLKCTWMMHEQVI